MSLSLAPPSVSMDETREDLIKNWDQILFSVLFISQSETRGNNKFQENEKNEDGKKEWSWFQADAEDGWCRWSNYLRKRLT